MEEVIYIFLDDYIGDEVKVKSSPDNEFYALYSKNEDLIFSFKINVWDRIVTYRNTKLCKTVARFFSIDDDLAIKYVKDWFDKKHNITGLIDLKKFMTNEKNT